MQAKVTVTSLYFLKANKLGFPKMWVMLWVLLPKICKLAHQYAKKAEYD